MELRGSSVYLGDYTRDPFISDDWPAIVAEVQEQHPDMDLITFKMPQYVGLASISEQLDPMRLAAEMMPKGVLVMGSNKKVNLMTQAQFSEVAEMIERVL